MSDLIASIAFQESIQRGIDRTKLWLGGAVTVFALAGVVGWTQLDDQVETEVAASVPAAVERAVSAGFESQRPLNEARIKEIVRTAVDEAVDEATAREQFTKEVRGQLLAAGQLTGVLEEKMRLARTIDPENLDKRLRDFEIRFSDLEEDAEALAKHTAHVETCPEYGGMQRAIGDLRDDVETRAVALVRGWLNTERGKKFLAEVSPPPGVSKAVARTMIEEALAPKDEPKAKANGETEASLTNTAPRRGPRFGDSP